MSTFVNPATVDGPAGLSPMDLQSAGSPGHGPLSDVRVIELGSVVAGPFAGRLLADLGADVIKVEAPDRPDALRQWGQRAHKGQRLWWTVHARNKRCVTIDLRREEGQELALRLIAEADVVVENFRPGTLERWNLGFKRMEAVNPGIVLCRVSGFGQTGPYSQRAGYASVAEAMGGLRAINGYPGQKPPRMAISLGDSLGGLFAVHGILAALHHRHRTGEGQVVDVALTEACMALLESAIPEHDRTGHVRGPGGTRLEGIAPSNLFETSDGSWVVIAANHDTVFARLCVAMGYPELSSDLRFSTHEARGEHQDEIEDIVAKWAIQHSLVDVQTCLLAHGVVVGPVYTVDQMVNDPHFKERESFVPHFDPRVGEDVLGPGVVPKFSRTPGAVRWAGRAEPGTDNTDVFTRVLSMTRADISRLAQANVI